MSGKNEIKNVTDASFGINNWWSSINTWNNLLDVLNNVSTLWELITALWFEETLQLQLLRANIIVLLKNGEDYIKEYKKYEDIAKTIIDTWPLGPDGKKIPMFVLDLVHASIIREWWNRNYMELYWDYINSARDVCRNNWDDKMNYLIHDVTKPKKS